MNEQNQRDSIMSMARGAFEERVDYEMDTDNHKQHRTRRTTQCSQK